MNKSVLTLAVLVAMLSLFLVGCGGGDSTLGTSNTNPVVPDLNGQGTLSFSVDWAQITKDYTPANSKVIYPTVNSIKVEVKNSSTGAVVQTVVLPRPSGVTTTSTSISVATGTYNVDCAGYTSADGSGTTPVSHRRKYAKVVANTTTNIQASLGVSIIGGLLTPSKTYVQPGDTLYWSNNDSVEYRVISTTAGVDLTIPAFDPNASTATNEKSFTFTTASSTSGFPYDLKNSAGTILQTGYVVVQVQTGGSYVYSSTNSKFNVAVSGSNLPYDITSATGYDLASDSNYVYVLNGAQNRVEKYDHSGVWADTFVTADVPGTPTDLTVDSSGNIYVVNGTVNLFKYNSAGTYVDARNVGTANNSLAKIAYTSAGNGMLYAAMNGNAAASNGFIYTDLGSSFQGSTWTAVNAAFGANAIGDIAVDTNKNVFFSTTTAASAGNVWIYTAGGTNAAANVTGGAANTISSITVNNSVLFACSNAGTNGVWKATIDASPVGLSAITQLTNITGGNTQGKINSTTGIVATSTNNFYTVDRGTTFARLQRFDSTGLIVSGTNQWFTFGGFNAYDAPLAVDSSGNLYVGDKTRVVKLDSAGKYKNTFGLKADGSGSYFDTARNAVAVDATGNMYVGNGTKVYKLDTTGAIGSGLWASGVSTPNSANVWALAVDSSGNVYVTTDGATNKVYKFDSSGAKITGVWNDGISTNNAANGIAVNNSTGTVYVSVNADGKIKTINASGGVSDFVTPGYAPKAIFVDASGNVYAVTVSGTNYRIYKYNSAGTLLTHSGDGTWTFTGTIQNLGGVVTDPSSGYLKVIGLVKESNTIIKSLGVFTPNSI